MTDRELLELAAKAAGIKFHSYVDHEIFGKGINIVEVDVPLWNPLINDGDAFRLQCLLCFNVDVDGLYITVTDSEFVTVEKIAFSPSGTCEEVRRAITCAAAEIGKHMP